MFLGLGYDTWTIVGVLVLGVLAVSYESWLPLLQSAGLNVLNYFKTKPPVPPTTTTTTTTPPVVDPDILDLQAAKRLQLRFKTRNCPEGTAAIAVVFEHFFHGDTV